MGSRTYSLEKPQEHTILFMHLHKTGGTTILKLLDTIYKKGEVYHIKGAYFRESAEELKKLPDEQKRKYKIIKGHMFFGLHEFLPQSSVYITMLREPLEKILSNYYWALERPNFQYHDEIVKKRMSFEEFMHRGIGPALDNGMTRFISGYDLDRVPYGRCSSDLLKIAKKNLGQHFLGIGLTESFDESLILFQKLIGWERMPFYKKHNITKEKPPKLDIPDSVHKSIEKYIELDLELYRFAKRLYADLITKMNDGFRDDVQLFKTLNAKAENVGT